MVIGIKIRKAGIFIKPKLKGMLVNDFDANLNENAAIKKPIEAALPIDLLIV